MLKLWVIKELFSDWRIPIMPVPKPDGTTHLCINFRKIDVISKFDAYSIPCVEELFDQLGEAEYVTTLDLIKGYWQILLTSAYWEKRAFPTPFIYFQFQTKLFGLHEASVTFQ